MKTKMEELALIISDYNKNNFSNLALYENRDLVKEFYNILLEKKIIKMNKNGKITKIIKSKIVAGPLSVKKKFGFILGEEDYYVYSTKGYIDGDIVIAIIDESRKGSTTEAKILELFERNEKLIMCRVNGRKKIILLGDNVENYRVLLADKEEQNLFNERQIVQFRVIDIIENTLIVKYEKVVSDENDPDLQMKIILANYGIETDFSNETLEQIEEYSEVHENDYEGRVDLREELVMTIDGADSKDLDDAIHLVKEKNGYRLTVSIADVSHYVQEGTPLDLDAYKRGTSVYFVDRVVPMLPKKLSNGICSLHPNVDRLTLSCEMLINEEGHVVESKIFESVINSKHRLTYDFVNQLIVENNPELIKDNQEIYGILKTMNQLRRILNKKRLNRGSFNLEDKDAKFKVNDAGDIVDIVPFVRDDAEKLIEEFMIVANETVAETIFWMELPFIYRIHDKPNPRKLKEVLQMFAILGIQIKGDIEEFHPQMFKQALDQIEEPINKRIVSDLIVRSLSKAKYSEKNIGHFGLASKYYTHFTSPIRRYPDLIVHRNLRKYLIENNVNYTDGDFDTIHQIGLWTSEKEVNAIKAEQTIEDIKKAEYMEQFIGQEFEGNIASVLEFGFFVELENTVRGLIRFSNIKEFNKAVNYKIFFKDDVVMTIGDKVPLKLVSVDKKKGLVEFELVGFTMQVGGKRENNRTKQKSSSRLYNSKNVRNGNRAERKRNKGDTKRKHQPKR